jgi:ribosome-binding ATPase YchF (GTP1/OBG family)
MKAVITGLPQAGQQELFSLLTKISLNTLREHPMEAQQGICEVKDSRITRLSEFYKPEKTTYARIEFMLLPDFNLQGPAKEMVFKELKNAEEICWVCSAETAESDISSFLSELIIADLMLVEKRLDTIAKDLKKKFSDQREKERLLIERCKKQLDLEKPLRELEFNGEEKKVMPTYQFFTMKPIVIVINVPEDQVKDQAISKKIAETFKLPCVQVSAGLEAEISQLDEADRKAFMAEVGIAESALDKMTTVTFSSLGLISFFTVGTDEVRAWPVRIGASAAEAGGVIHSDIEKGFVKAEMFRYEDLFEAGSEAKLKETGKFYLKGKDYIVQDGDCLSFRFNV